MVLWTLDVPSRAGSERTRRALALEAGLLLAQAEQLRTACREPDRDETEPGYRSGLSLELMRPSPPYGHARCGCTALSRARQEHRTRQMSATAPLSLELRHYTTCPETGSHLGPTLKPGGAVLTRGVSRRSGSVACIRAAASPNEVLAHSMMQQRLDPVKSFRTGVLINLRIRYDNPVWAALTRRVAPAGRRHR